MLAQGGVNPFLDARSRTGSGLPWKWTCQLVCELGFVQISYIITGMVDLWDCGEECGLVSGSCVYVPDTMKKVIRLGGNGPSMGRSYLVCMYSTEKENVWV